MKAMLLVLTFASLLFASSQSTSASGIPNRIQNKTSHSSLVKLSTMVPSYSSEDLSALATQKISERESYLRELATLKAFESDACTMFVNGPPSKPNLWEHCCFEHDLRYWFGGAMGDMDFSDLELRACVKSVANDRWANLIYNGVRAGHSSPVKSKYHWGWGWLPLRQDTVLSSDEIAYIIDELNRLPLNDKFRAEFIQKYLKSNPPK